MYIIFTPRQDFTYVLYMYTYMLWIAPDITDLDLDDKTWTFLGPDLWFSEQHRMNCIIQS